MLLLLNVIGCVAFIATAGLLFNERYRKNYIVLALTALITFASTLFTIKEGWTLFSPSSKTTSASVKKTDIRTKMMETSSPLRSETDAQLVEHSPVTEAFAAASYSNGVVIVGIRAQQEDDNSVQAAMQLLIALNAALRGKGLPVDEFRPGVYASGYFAAMLNGDTSSLEKGGMNRKMRAALVAGVSTQCRHATEIQALTSCAISAQVRLVTPDGRTSLLRLSETGAGTTLSQALVRGAELMVERHPELLNGI